MKLVLALAGLLAMTTAFAQSKNSITFDVGDIVNQEGNYNTNLVWDQYKDRTDLEGSSKSLLVNYSREIVPQVQLKFILGYANSDDLTAVTDDLHTEITTWTYGLGANYNFNSDLTNTWFAGLTYVMKKSDYKKEMAPAVNTVDKSGNASTFMIEFGRRMKIGTIADMTFTWSPSVTYSMNKYDEDIAAIIYPTNRTGTADSSNELKINLLKMDLFF